MAHNKLLTESLLIPSLFIDCHVSINWIHGRMLFTHLFRGSSNILFKVKKTQDIEQCTLYATNYIKR